MYYERECYWGKGQICILAPFVKWQPMLPDWFVTPYGMKTMDEVALGNY